MKKTIKRLLGMICLTACVVSLFSTDVFAAEKDTTSENVITSEESKEAFYEHDYLFIGDSRFVGMNKAGVKKKNITWIMHKGARYDLYWQNRDQIAAMDKDTIVVYELGINDMAYQAEIATLQDLDSMGFYRVYYMAIMPVDEELEAENTDTVDPRLNADIKTMNKLVKKGLPEDVVFIPQFKMEVKTKDGLHYKKETYLKWYRKMVKFIGEDLINEGL